jgi:transketolase
VDTLESMPLDELCINTIRTLAMDAVQQADSGHPGTPMALAPLAYVLWTRCLRYNPGNPAWFNRDRFVLSAGHASMLLYAMLHLTGYDLTLDDLKRFRQWGSKTPGHPEHGVVPGVETTTGPLGQGFMNAVGMAMAEAHLAAVHNRPGHAIVDHRTYVLCSDGDMMEGASHEAASLAGHLGLGKLICIYDDNRITIEGSTALAFSDDVGARFEAYRWHVQNLGDRANDLDALGAALSAAQQQTERPSLIIVRSHIGYGAPHLQDNAKAHGAPLGEDEVRLTKRFYGWPEDVHFLVPELAASHMCLALQRGQQLQQAWEEECAAYREAHPQPAAAFQAAVRGELPAGWDDALPQFRSAPVATRSASGKALNAIARKVPWLMGGSADLAPSTNTLIDDGGDFERAQRPLGDTRTRHVRRVQRHGAARRRAPVRRFLSHLHRLRAAGNPARRHDGAAGHLRHDARLYWAGGGRTDASAGRAAGVAARRAQPVRHPPRRCQRGGARLARRDAAPRRPHAARAHPPADPGARPKRAGRCSRVAQGRLRSVA